jgi:hypothetical protein
LAVPRCCCRRSAAATRAAVSCGGAPALARGQRGTRSAGAGAGRGRCARGAGTAPAPVAIVCDASVHNMRAQCRGGSGSHPARWGTHSVNPQAAPPPGSGPCVALLAWSQVPAGPCGAVLCRGPGCSAEGRGVVGLVRLARRGRRLRRCASLAVSVRVRAACAAAQCCGGAVLCRCGVAGRGVVSCRVV